MDNNTASRKPRILIVDDHAEALKLEGILFEAVGAEVMTASGGEEAIALFRSKNKAGAPFDMVVVDIHMPDPNGYDVALTMRSDGFKGAIVAFTAHVTGRNKSDSRASGISTYLSKSSLKKDLVEALLRQHCPWAFAA